jgi:hypothetical protein
MSGAKMPGLVLVAIGGRTAGRPCWYNLFHGAPTSQSIQWEDARLIFLPVRRTNLRWDNAQMSATSHGLGFVVAAQQDVRAARLVRLSSCGKMFHSSG